MEEKNCIYKEKCLQMVLKIFHLSKAPILSVIQTIFYIAIGIIALVGVTYFFTIFLHAVTAIASYFLVDLSSMPQNDIIAKTIRDFFKFTKDDVPTFSKAVSQTAIGALIGTSFTLFVNFLIKSFSEKRNRLTSLRTALIVVELNIGSLLLLKKKFTESKIFKTLPPDYAIDLDPKQFFYLLETETKSNGERLDTMLYHYCKAKENIDYFNKAIKCHQGQILPDTLKLLDAILVFLFELEREIKDFPGIPKSKGFLREDLSKLIPKEGDYKDFLDEWYYNRHKSRKKQKA